MTSASGVRHKPYRPVFQQDGESVLRMPSPNAVLVCVCMSVRARKLRGYMSADREPEVKEQVQGMSVENVALQRPAVHCIAFADYAKRQFDGIPK